jgi:hypothetical protein
VFSPTPSHTPYPVIGCNRPAPGGTQKTWGNGFEIETPISLRAAAGLNITEVPSHEHARIHGQSNLSTFRDGRRVLRTIFTE